MTNDRFALARAEAERLVRAGGLSYERIGKRVGVCGSTVFKWTNRYDWQPGPVPMIVPAVPASGLTQAGLGPDGKPAPAGQRKKRRRKKPRPVDRARLIERLYLAIDHNLQLLEQRMKDDTTPTAADGERDARALATAIRNIEKVTELEAGTERDANAPRENGHGFTSADADRLRLELAERILRICRSQSKSD